VAIAQPASQGDILEIVLDVFPVEVGGEKCHRVQFRGVFPRGSGLDHPPLRPGAQRNRLQVFYGVPHDVDAFLINDGGTG
jgi:hypothetical protein